MLEEELHKLDNFKESKDKMEEMIQGLENELKVQEDAHMQALTTSERKVYYFGQHTHPLLLPLPALLCYNYHRHV